MSSDEIHCLTMRFGPFIQRVIGLGSDTAVASLANVAKRPIKGVMSRLSGRPLMSITVAAKLPLEQPIQQ